MTQDLFELHIVHFQKNLNKFETRRQQPLNNPMYIQNKNLFLAIQYMQHKITVWEKTKQAEEEKEKEATQHQYIVYK